MVLGDTLTIYPASNQIPITVLGTSLTAVNRTFLLCSNRTFSFCGDNTRLRFD